MLNYKVETNQNKNKKLDKFMVIALRRIAFRELSAAELEQDLLNTLRMRCKTEPLVEQDETENLEGKI